MASILARRQGIVWIAVVGLAVLHLAWLATNHAPAISTPDANSYFAQARYIARAASTSFVLASPAQFVAPHWNVGANGRYYCTHPPGLGALMAIPYALFGYRAATWVNPILASLSLIVVFLLSARLNGSRWALLTMAVVALTPFANEHALFSDSHIAVQFLLLCALFCLMRMTASRASSAWGLAAGLCAGAIPTVRYPEALLLLPLGLYVLWAAHRRHIAWGVVLWFAVGAALPLLAVLARNQIAYGGFWKTGYAATGEESAFSLAALVGYAPVYLSKLLTEGVWLMFPLGLVGMVALVAGSKTRSAGLLLVGLVVPITLLYMAWYWGPDAQSMRFLIPTFPLYALAGVWLLSRLIRKPAVAVSVAAVVLLATALWGVPRATVAMQHLQSNNRVLAAITDMLERQAPPGSVVIAGIGIQQHLDFVGLWKLADATLLQSRPPNASQAKGPGAQAVVRPDYHGQPIGASADNLLAAAQEWTGEGGLVFVLATPLESATWTRQLRAGTRLEERDRITLPNAQALRQGGPGGSRPPGGVAGPGPNAIFDLELAGQPLQLYLVAR